MVDHLTVTLTVSLLVVGDLRNIFWKVSKSKHCILDILNEIPTNIHYSVEYLAEYCQVHGNLVDHFFVFARSRLYQRRFLRPRSHFSAFFELYMFSFAPLQISVIFQILCTVFWRVKIQKTEKMVAQTTVKRRVC